MTILVTDIDTRVGTYNSHAFSNGNTLPLTGYPFGMNYFALQTNQDKGSWFFNPHEPVYQGIRLTHQPSPWLGDFSWLLLTPMTNCPKSTDIFFRQSSYLRDKAIFSPNKLQIESTRYQLKTELVPTLYGACLTLTATEAIQLALYAPGWSDYHQVDDYTIQARLENASETQDPHFSMYVTLKFDQPITAFENLDREKSSELTGQELHSWIQFAHSSVECRLATSFISQEQADFNLRQIQDFASESQKTQDKWQSLLDRIQVTQAGETSTEMFGHCLYRTLLFPQTFYEVDAHGKEWHYDTTSRSAKAGKFFTNNGYWDTFRSNYPLLSLSYSDYLEQFLEGIYNFYQDTDYLPKWLSPDERGIMPGTLVDGVIADACQKGLCPDLMPQLLEAMIETREKPDPNLRYGRHGADVFDQYGYLPNDFRESVSHTLDYAYSDYCIGKVANIIRPEIADKYFQKSLGYRQLFDSQTGYIRSKNRQGQFNTNFNPYSWGKDYAECSAIQASLAPLHDIEGLIELMGGEDKFLDYLLKLCKDEPIFAVDGYGYEIHEMSEMAQVQFGQLALSNQPSFHIPYLYQWTSKPEYTALMIHALRNQLFRPSFDGYPGDEDNGSMSAWYIWSCLGFYPVCPGNGDYQLGLPYFEEVKLYLSQKDKWLTIRCDNAYQHFQFLSSAQLDGQVLKTIQHSQLLEAQELTFTRSILP
ncbi:GH92 family glycosyl hydrolase [Streptococcus gallolyticus]|uniref:GH92 family glycosyl hydrolase n=1 Tax=Streptococcus hepaticus TaxID=3349163 RepID=UPI001C948318|nr:GH92 family glycosyl hydrolase [Streptococcus gallolyticus]MBY5041256.1 GH92 family glycosyl hydrolase [Streptococcus gallolyticus]